MPLNQLKQKILKRCGRQVQSAFKVLALFSIWYGMHLGMRGFKEQHDCQLDDFIVTEQYIE